LVDSWIWQFIVRPIPCPSIRSNPRRRKRKEEEKEEEDENEDDYAFNGEDVGVSEEVAARAARWALRPGR